MPLLRGGFRLFKAVTSVIGWPARVKMAPFSVPETAQIPAFWEKDCNTSTGPRWRADEITSPMKAEWLRLRLRASFADPDNFPLAQSARDRSQNSDSDNDTSHSPEEPPMVPRATHLKALADKDVIEEAIRREADPRGLYRRSTIDTAGLVKSIRKRHRDGMEEHRREKEAMRIEREDLKRGFEDEKGALSNIIRHQNQARDEEGLNIRDENHELRSKNQKLLQESESKDQSVKELTEEKEALVKTCQEITEGSLVSLRIADRQMNHRIVRLTSKHEDELAEIRGWCSTLQERLAIARRLQPAIVLHRAQVGTVCEMHAKLVDLKKAKKEELAAKDREHAVLRTRNGQQEREIRDLKTMAEADGEVLEKTAGLLSDTRKKLNGAEDKIENQRREVKNLNQCGRAWETAYRAKDKEYTALKSEMGTLEANQRMELIRAEAQSGALEVKIDSLGTANDNMKKELESWENGHRGILGVSEPKHIETPPDLKSLVMALKAANTRADALQISANALQAENGALKRWLETATSASIMQVQEPVERLQSENSSLREAAEKATVLETQLTARLAEAEQKLGKRFEDRTRELEDGFNQGFENLRELREQWLLQKRGLEEQHNRDMIAEDLRCEIERQSREDQMMATLRKREENLQHNEDDLQSREAKLADEVKYVANPQSDEDAKEVSMLATEVSEASSLLQEIESSCVVQGSVGQNVLRELNKAKSALHRVKTELRNPQSVARRNHFLTMVSGANMNEQHIQQLNTATQAVLVRQAKEASARLQNLQKILDANEDVQKEAMLGALNAPNPFHRATKNARGLKRHTQPGSSMIPSSSSTGAQAGASMGQSQQTNNNAEQQYDPRPLDSQQNVQPQFPAASPQDQIQGLAPPRFSGATNGSTLPTQANASQYTPSTGSRFDVPSTPTNNVQHVDKVQHMPFADILKSLQSPASSDKQAAAVVPQPISENNASSTRPADSPATIPQAFSIGSKSSLPGLAENDGAAESVIVPRSQRPINNARGRRPINFLGSRQLARQALTRRSGPSPGSAQVQRSSPEEQEHTQQGASGCFSQQNHPTAMPAGWTDSMTETVRHMLQQGDEIEFIEELVKAMYDFQPDDTQCLEKWLRKLQSDHKAEMENP